MIKIVVADDHPLVREGIKVLVEAEGDMQVVGEVGSVLQIEPLFAEMAPDVVLLDLNCPAPDICLQGLKFLLERHPAARVLVFSMYRLNRFALQALKLGAVGYLCKTARTVELMEAIRSVHASGDYISPQVALLLVQEIRRAALAKARAALTQRELQLVSLLSDGKGMNEIKHAMAISANSISAYRRRIFRKIGVGSTEALVRYACKYQLVR
jgi:DNA-binding NarL/FixJ family response regulator